MLNDRANPDFNGISLTFSLILLTSWSLFLDDSVFKRAFLRSRKKIICRIKTWAYGQSINIHSEPFYGFVSVTMDQPTSSFCQKYTCFDSDFCTNNVLTKAKVAENQLIGCDFTYQHDEATSYTSKQTI